MSVPSDKKDMRKPVRSMPIEITPGTKALVYIHFQTRKYYSRFVILGGVILFASLFNGLPGYSAAMSPLIGFIVGYVDNFLTCYYLAQKPSIFAARQDWYEIIRSARGFPPLLQAPEKIKLFSREGLKLYLAQAKPFSPYESYKIALPVFFLLLTHLLSPGQGGAFNWDSTFCAGPSRTYIFGIRNSFGRLLAS